MANLNVDLTNSGFENRHLYVHSGVVEEIHEELLEKSNDPKEMLGWLHLPSNYYNTTEYKKIKKAAKKIISDSEVLIVIGIGGSYLGAKAVIEALKSPFRKKDSQYPEVIFVGNNLSTTYINDVIEYVQDKDISINVISKSGTTTEPAIAFRIFRELIENKYPLDEARKRIYVTTDSSKGALKKLAESEKYETFVIPDDIGGRYSVLTPVGLLPIAASGLNIDELMQGAISAEDRFDDSILEYNECYKYAVLRNLLYEDDKSLEMLVTYTPRLHYFTEWWKQLFGESEGKDGKGLFPVGVEYTTDLHSLGQYVQDGRRLMFETVLFVDREDKQIVINTDEDNIDNLNYLEGQNIAYVNRKAMEATMRAHVDGGVPNVFIRLKRLNEETLGELIYFFEKACAMSAELLEVNPFNQPGVEVYKTNMFRLLGKPGYDKESNIVKPLVKGEKIEKKNNIIKINADVAEKVKDKEEKAEKKLVKDNKEEKTETVEDKKQEEKKEKVKTKEEKIEEENINKIIEIVKVEQKEAVKHEVKDKEERKETTEKVAEVLDSMAEDISVVEVAEPEEKYEEVKPVEKDKDNVNDLINDWDSLMEQALKDDDSKKNTNSTKKVAAKKTTEKKSIEKKETKSKPRRRKSVKAEDLEVMIKKEKKEKKVVAKKPETKKKVEKKEAKTTKKTTTAKKSAVKKEPVKKVTKKVAVKKPATKTTTKKNTTKKTTAKKSK